MRARLDATDWRILKELQANGRITNVELAEKVGISPPPCLRRVRALEQAGADRVTLWLPEGLRLEELLREMEAIAGDLL